MYFYAIKYTKKIAPAQINERVSGVRVVELLSVKRKYATPNPIEGLSIESVI